MFVLTLSLNPVFVDPVLARVSTAFPVQLFNKGEDGFETEGLFIMKNENK